MSYPVVPFRKHLALADFSAKFYYGLLDRSERKRRKDGFEITTKLIRKMDHLVRENGSSFFVAVLGEPAQYESFFKNSGISSIDCRLDLDEKYAVRGEGHPNGKAHSLWAEEIATFLQSQPGFRAASGQPGLKKGF